MADLETRYVVQQPNPAWLGPVAKDNLTNRVYAELRAALLEGRLWPGQRLKIRELAKAMQVSDTPVREAVMQLVRERGLEMAPRGAITVARLSLAQYLELRRIRLELEGLAAEVAASRVTKWQIESLAETHETLVAAEAARDWATAIRANWRFHFSLYQAAGMPELVAILEGIWLRNGPLLNYHYPHAPPTYASRHQHLNVLDALAAQNPGAVRKAIQDDMIEGGKRLVALLGDMEAGRVVIQPDIARAAVPGADP